MRRLIPVAVASGLLLVPAAPALAYPKTLLDAVVKAYAPRATHIDGFCHEKIGRYVYVRVDVTLVKTGAARRAAFQAARDGWRVMWRDGSIVRTVPKRQRAHFRWIIRELNRFCGA